MTLTLNQQEETALDFYAEQENYVTYFGLTNLDREDRILYRKGKKLMQSALDVKTTRTYTKYQDSEVIFLVQTYVETDGQDALFFAHPVRLGANGVEEILPYGELSAYEEKAKADMLDGLKNDIQIGLDFVK